MPATVPLPGPSAATAVAPALVDNVAGGSSAEVRRRAGEVLAEVSAATGAERSR
ncbi:MAG TPA: hypothetical protein VM263_05920 [Acidimicrobiales bacterium]|nr:hypothetical protein [Acidimicrobiales bacterium]